MSNKKEIVLPRMGESVDEATITGWLKNEGDVINEDDLIVEIATDKVDSEVPSDVEGILIEKCFKINDVVKVGETLCVIETVEDSNQKIIEDLNNFESPQTAIGFIVAGLRERYLNGKRPFTILSCDNLPNNGALVKKLVLDFAQKIDPTFTRWISKKVCFPSSMVDRITPATKDQDIVNFAKDYGLYDPCLLYTSPSPRD